MKDPMAREREILRYLGYKGAGPDENTRRLLDQAAVLVEGEARPRHILRRFALTIKDDRITIPDAGLDFMSKDLAGNLEGCRETYLYAATLGVETDRLLARNLKLDMSLAVVIQATAAAFLEEYIDRTQKELAEELAGEHLYIRPRFSPGYGDLPLNIQADFLNALEAGKRIGITLSEGGIMIPEKSVTAIMGISNRKSRYLSAGCEECGKEDCQFHQ